MNPKKRKGLMLVHEGAYREIVIEIEEMYGRLKDTTDMSDAEIVEAISDEIGIPSKDICGVLFGTDSPKCDNIREADVSRPIHKEHLEAALRIARKISSDLGKDFMGEDYVNVYGEDEQIDEILAAQELLQQFLEGELEGEIEKQISSPVCTDIDNLITFIEDEIRYAILTINEQNNYFSDNILPKVALVQQHLEKSCPESIVENKMISENKSVNVVQDENGVYYFESDERDLGEAIGRILRDREIKFTSKQKDGKFCIFLNVQEFNKDQQVSSLAKKIKKDLDNRYAAMRYAEAAKEIDPDSFNNVKEIQSEIEERSDADEIDIVLDTLKRMDGDVSEEDMDEEYDEEGLGSSDVVEEEEEDEKDEEEE